MIRSYKAVFFDAGGTLLHPYPSVGEIYQEVASRHGCRVSGEELQQRFMQEWRKREGLSKLTVHNSEKVEREWWKQIVQDTFSGYPVEDFEAFFAELYDVFARPQAWHLYSGVHEVLGTLKRSGKKLAIISNWDSRLFRLCDDLNITQYFDCVLASAVFGSSKPSAKIFEEGLKRTGAKPHEAVHVGDSFEDDIKGAHGAGIHGILIDRHRHHEHEEHHPVKPYKVIRDLKELL